MTIPTQAEDLVLVPREPTREMLDRAQQDAAHHDTARRGYGFRDTWLSMISAVPSIGGGEGDSSSSQTSPSSEVFAPLPCRPEGPSPNALVRVIAEDLIALAEGVGAHLDLQDGPCEVSCCSFICPAVGCIKDKADRARLYLSLEAHSGGSRPQEAVKSDGPSSRGKDT